ncbi:flavin reductase family protein [Amycolatopsis saalfeldensis]|uniref:NADH-FMN oxidoreductase RutF, flavin reductase (DIM6/NTAB) family n=1 Tax=Amycolatopsis saalfeldensis TaxID=394193 RepID=A0A1H8U507_9PSEU|nr:flavin reductase family protein [Amycolatopsis saalfeldensis]SEO98146.1 NADH-FMN oxidoreductase RutF, flavin reductase (DIM6/NTAB) family [Amycolatopsis saalfeldensis]
MIELESVTGDPVQLRQAYGCFPSGVTAVCALEDGVPVGIAASSFTPVSMDPPLVSLCVQNTSATWPRLRPLPRLGVSVLGQDQNAAARRLAAKDGDRFAELGLTRTDDGGVLVHGAVAWLDCSVHAEVPAGDHAIVLLWVHALRASPEDAPLVFHGSRFRRLAVV